MTFRPLATKDNASGQLDAGINASSTSIVLGSGEGASFPTVYRDSATSGGTTVTLNCTGIGATGVAVGDYIENVTDGSWAIITAVDTNSVTTTRLRGGTDNTWQNSDVWAVNRFVITLVQYDTDGSTVLKREKVLIGDRSTDTLTVETVPSSGRGHDSSSASSYDADDYVYLLDTRLHFEGLKAALADVAQLADSALSAAATEIYGASSGGTDAYAITVTPAPSAYSAGMTFTFKADVANTGAATLNVNSLGAKTIKKNHDQDLADGDIEANQVVTVVYNATDDTFEMMAHIGNTSAAYTPDDDSLTAGVDISQNDALAVAKDGGDTLSTETINDTTPASSGFGYATTSFHKLAQSVQGSGNYIGKVQCNMFKNGSPTDNVTVSIQADSGGEPDGTPLASATVSYTAISGWVDFEFSSPIFLSSGTTYWVVAERTGSLNTSNYYRWYNSTSSVYANGNQAIYQASAWSDEAAKDNALKLVEYTMAGKVYPADSDNADLSDTFIGFATAAASAGASVTFQFGDVMDGFTSLTPGAVYYTNATAGDIGTSAGSNTKKVGIAISSTKLLILPTL